MLASNDNALQPHRNCGDKHILRRVEDGLYRYGNEGWNLCELILVVQSIIIFFMAAENGISKF